MEEKEETEELTQVSKVLKESTISNPDITFCEKTTYLDFLLTNAQTKEEQEEIKKIVDNYLEIADDGDDED